MAFKNCQKNEKMHFSLQWAGTPLFLDFRGGGHTSSILSNSCSFLRYAFLGLKFIVQNNDFWEKSFYYSSFYAQKLSFDSNVTHFWNSSTNPNNTYWLLCLYSSFSSHDNKLWLIPMNRDTDLFLTVNW